MIIKPASSFDRIWILNQKVFQWRQRKRDQQLINKNNFEIGIAFYSQNQFTIKL